MDDDTLLHIARTTLTKTQYATMSRKKWKDGIDIDVPTFELRKLAQKIIFVERSGKCSGKNTNSQDSAIPETCAETHSRIRMENRDSEGTAK